MSPPSGCRLSYTSLPLEPNWSVFLPFPKPLCLSADLAALPAPLTRDKSLSFSFPICEMGTVRLPLHMLLKELRGTTSSTVSTSFRSRPVRSQPGLSPALGPFPIGFFLPSCCLSRGQCHPHFLAVEMPHRSRPEGQRDTQVSGNQHTPHFNASGSGQPAVGGGFWYNMGRDREGGHDLGVDHVSPLQHSQKLSEWDLRFPSVD